MTKLTKVALPIGLITTFFGIGLLFGPKPLPAVILIVIGLTTIFLSCLYNFLTIMENPRNR